MATVEHIIATGDGWVQIAADGIDFLVENVDRGNAFVTLQAAAPAATAPFHTLQRGDAMVRVGTGAAYVRSEGPLCRVVVTS